MKELAVNTNSISKTIKWAFEVKKVSLEPDRSFTRFLPFDAIRNMRNIVNGKEIQVSEYKSFFETFTEFLNKEILNKELLAQLYQGEKNGDLLPDSEDATFKLKGLEEKFQKKPEHAVYLKILTLLASSSFSKLTPAQVLKIYNTLEFFLNKSGFFQSVDAADFSTKMDAIYYSLTHAESFEAAKMLVRLSNFDVLTEDNLKKLNGNPQLNITLFSSVLNKLSLNGGTTSLLNQGNLDKLLDNPELNIEVLAKFIQAEDKSKILTQEKFDLAINLKNLLTLENIAKIEKPEVDRIQLSEIFSLLDKANILTQDNFNIIINLKKSDLVDLFQTLSKVNNSDLSQELLSQCMEMYGRIKDFEAQNRIPSNSHEGHSDSLAQRFCAAILRIKVLTKNIFDKIIEFFINKINFHAEKQVTVKIDLARNPNSLFTPVLSREYPESNAINTNTIVCN